MSMPPPPPEAPPPAAAAPAAPRPPFRLLVCVSGGPRSAQITGEAVQLVRHLEGELHIVHASRDDGPMRERLLAIAREVGAAPDPVIHLRPGATHEVVRDVAASIRADLVLAGALERESLWRELFGSSARRIARKVECPILLLTAPRAEGSRFQRFALMARPDDATADALAYLLPFLRPLPGAELHLLHEKDYFDRLAGRLAPGGGRSAAPAMSNALLELEAFVEGFDFGDLALKVVELPEGEAIASVAYVKRHGLDLLVCPAPPRPMTLWDRFANHPLELVLGALPPALLIHRRRPPRGGAVPSPAPSSAPSAAPSAARTKP